MATAEKTLTDSYQLLIAGPAVVTLEKGKVAMLHIASSTPSSNAAAHRLVRGTDRESFTYNGYDNIYVKKTDPANDRVVIVAYTAG